ncbi:hypothetical protein [Arthrobacter sp. B1I2]|uniref:hypothetical protein n=1 Tax=Arthrobacter sp. B1I2 TaxID=3042263 RepID=UPI0027827BC9|nr:hypothetical protein [Arthrobacter sp. B1I2]MDQ0729715.1 hypothetical protein [Arthrobacter sp. B1I2]
MSLIAQITSTGSVRGVRLPPPCRFSVRPGRIGVVGKGVRAPCVATSGVGMPFPAIPSAAIRSDVGIEFVSLPGMGGNVTPQGLGFMGPLLGFLPKARCVNLCLLSISPRPNGLSFPLTGINFHILGFTPDFGSLFPVLLVPFLLGSLPALSTGQKEHHDQCNDNNGNYHPYPWSCIHFSHHFPLRCDRAGPRHSG